VIAVASKVLLENIGPSEIRCHLARLVRYRQVTLMVIWGAMAARVRRVNWASS